MHIRQHAVASSGKVMIRGIDPELVGAASSPQFWLVAVVVVAILLWSRLRGRTRRPSPGDVWFAEVAFSDGSGSKDRPVLVLAVNHGAVQVATFTTQDKSRRRDYVRVPIQVTGQPRTSWVSLKPRHLRQSALRRRIVKGDANLLAWYLRVAH